MNSIGEYLQSPGNEHQVQVVIKMADRVHGMLGNVVRYIKAGRNGDSTPPSLQVPAGTKR